MTAKLNENKNLPVTILSAFGPALPPPFPAPVSILVPVPISFPGFGSMFVFFLGFPLLVFFVLFLLLDASRLLNAFDHVLQGKGLKIKIMTFLFPSKFHEF